MALHLIFIITLLVGSAASPLPEACLHADEILTEQEAVRLALINNPDLHVSLEQLRAAQTLVQQARGYPATSVDFEFNQNELLRSYGDVYFGLSQLFEYPTRRGLRVSVAEAQTKLSESEYDLIGWELTLTVKMLYLRLAFNQSLIVHFRENLVISNALVDLASKRFDAGSVSKLDVLRADVEAANTSDQLLSLENEERNHRMLLNFLLGRQADAPLRTTPLAKLEASAQSVDDLINIAFDRRIEFRALRNQENLAVLKQSLARSDYYPDFSAGLARHAVSGDMDSWKVTLGIVIPIFGRGAIRGRIAQAEAEERIALTAMEAEKSRVAGEVSNAFAEVSKHAERVAQFEGKTLIQAREAFKLAEANYREGEIDNLELLESQRTLQEVRKGYAQTLFEYDLAVINLERAVGKGLR